MRFRLFGIPTEIQLGFWFISVFLGMGRLQGSHQYLIVEWVFVVLISILVHELGHALAMGRYGLPSNITLYAMGGVTRTPSSDYGRLSRGQRMFVSFAGPSPASSSAAWWWRSPTPSPRSPCAPSTRAAPPRGPSTWAFRT